MVCSITDVEPVEDPNAAIADTELIFVTILSSSFWGSKILRHKVHRLDCGRTLALFFGRKEAPPIGDPSTDRAEHLRSDPESPFARFHALSDGMVNHFADVEAAG
jgi:hypothetical protein